MARTAKQRAASRRNLIKARSKRRRRARKAVGILAVGTAGYVAYRGAGGFVHVESMKMTPNQQYRMAGTHRGRGIKLDYSRGRVSVRGGTGRNPRRNASFRVGASTVGGHGDLIVNTKRRSTGIQFRTGSLGRAGRAAKRETKLSNMFGTPVPRSTRRRTAVSTASILVRGR